MLLHAKFINRAVFPDGRWLQPGEQVDWDQNNNRWSADNEFLDTYLLPRRFLSLQPPLHLLQATVVDFHSAEPGGGRGMRRKEVISLKRAQAGGEGPTPLAGPAVSELGDKVVSFLRERILELP